MKFLFFLFFILPCYSLQLSLIRHGNTINNERGIYTGHLDIPIIKTNKVEIDDKYDYVICSPMLRCKQTLDILNIDQKKVIFDNRLIECGYGELTGKKKNGDFERTFFNKPEDSSLFVGESIFEGGLRAYNAISYHRRHSLLKDSNVLILSHKNTLKGLWLFLKLEEIFNNSDVRYLNDFNILKSNIESILEKEIVPEFCNLKLEKI